MLIAAAVRAIGQVLSPGLRPLLWKSLGLTIALLALLWAALTRLFSWWVAGTTFMTDHAWLDVYAVLLAGVGLVVGLAYLIPSVSMLVAGFFLDDVAERVERESYPADPSGRPLPLAPALLDAARLALLSLGVNLLALLFLFVPGVNLVAFFLANAFLLGREYFSLAAGRFRSVEEVRALRARHGGTVALAGLMVAACAAVPIVNLLTPMFGVTLMVHVHKAIAAREARRVAAA
jgi:CysZ protein